jgi:hypothetical protein
VGLRACQEEKGEVKILDPAGTRTPTPRMSTLTDFDITALTLIRKCDRHKEQFSSNDDIIMKHEVRTTEE